MKKILYLLVMIVSLSFMVSASPPTPKPKIVKLRGVNIPMKKVSLRGKGFSTSRSAYQKPTVITLKKPKPKNLTPPKNDIFRIPLLPEEKPLSEIIKDIDPSVNGFPPLDYSRPYPQFKYYEKTQIFTKKIAEWIHSAEVYHTLIELIEALYELSSDSDSSDDSYNCIYSDTIVYDSTKAVQVVLLMKPIN